jgi:hypothetical protein
MPVNGRCPPAFSRGERPKGLIGMPLAALGVGRVFAERFA